MAVDLALLESTAYVLPFRGDRSRGRSIETAGIECCFLAERALFLFIFDASNLLRSMRHTGCRLLVIKRQNGGFSKAVSETIPCPLVLV